MEPYYGKEEADGDCPGDIVGVINLGNSYLEIDDAGRLFSMTPTDPTGFWKYLAADSAIHPSYMLHRTVTGRTASADPNGQNIPKRGGTPLMNRLVKAYRRIFVARPGYVLAEIDLSQAELRLAAWMAGEDNMLAVYQSGGDIHASTAAATMRLSDILFDELDTKVRSAERQKAKAVNFGFLYGMGWRKFRSFAKTDYGVDYSTDEAEEAREAFFAKYPGLAQWHAGMREFVKRHGYVRGLHGRLRRLPSINSDTESIQRDAERQAINSPIQGFASDLGLIAMIIFGRYCQWDVMRAVGFIHDAVILEIKEDHVDEATSAMKWIMENPPLQEWFGIEAPMPIVADISVGDNLADMEERGDVEAVRPEWLPDNFAHVCK